MPNEYTRRYDAERDARRTPSQSPRPGGNTSRSAGGRYTSPYAGASPRSYDQRPSGQRPSGQRPGSYRAPQYAPSRYARPAQRPASRPSGNRPRGGGTGGGQMPPVVKLMCLLMVALLCVGITVKITSSLTRDRRQQTVSLNTGEPLQTDTPATDSPAANAEPTNSPVPDWQEPETATDAPDTGLRRATIRTCGDVIMHEPLLDTALSYGGGSEYSFDAYFSTIKEVMADADWTVINIEATLHKNKYGYSGYPQFSTPPSILDTLIDCGVDMLTMCNNHMLDGFWDGLRESIGLVDAAGLKHVGAYTTPEEYNTPEIMEICGIKVGFLNYNETTNTMDQKSDSAATEYGFRYIKNADFTQQVQVLRNAGADVVVGYMHWGDEYERTPEASTKKYAQQLVAAGVDIVIGGHPHVVQPCEYVTATAADGTTRTALVVYSIGNFISDQRLQYRDSGFIFDFTIEEQADGTFKITNPTYIPTYVWRWGDEDTGYDYRILPIGQYMENPPAGMSDEEYARMKECWYEIYEQMGGNTVCTIATG